MKAYPIYMEAQSKKKKAESCTTRNDDGKSKKSRFLVLNVCACVYVWDFPRRIVWESKRSGNVLLDMRDLTRKKKRNEIKRSSLKGTNKKRIQGGGKQDTS